MPKKEYIQTDITIPKSILNGYARIKIVRALGNSGVIFVPKELIKKKVQVILIPIEDVEEEELNL